MISIPIGQGHVLLLDDDDAEWATTSTWRPHKSGRNATWYARARINNKNKFLHRLIMNATSSQQVDHIDGNGLNNTKANLRLCTASQNCQNRKKPRNTISKYKGVTLGNHNGKRMWRARITVNRQLIHLGWYLSESAAAEAYQKAASQYFGEFSRL